MPTIEAREPEEITDAFATAETVRVPLKGLGHSRWWVTVKRALTAGEQADVDEAFLRSVDADVLADAADTGNQRQLHVSFARQRFLRIGSYIHDWNLVDRSGQTVRIRGKTLAEKIQIMRNLNATVAGSIVEAIDSIVVPEAATDTEVDEKLAEKGDTTEELNPTNDGAAA